MYVSYSLYVCVIFLVYICEICPVCGIWPVCVWGICPMYFTCIAPSVHQLYPHRVEVGHPPEDCVCGGADQSDAGQHP